MLLAALFYYVLFALAAYPLCRAYAPRVPLPECVAALDLREPRHLALVGAAAAYPAYATARELAYAGSDIVALAALAALSALSSGGAARAAVLDRLPEGSAPRAAADALCAWLDAAQRDRNDTVPAAPAAPAAPTTSMET